VLVWTISVGGGFVVAKQWPEYGAIGPWAITCFYGLCLGAFLMIRFILGGWKQIRLHTPTAASNPTPCSDKVPGLELIVETP